MRNKIFYAMHMEHGVAEYRPKDKEMYRVLVEEKEAKLLDPTFAGKPVYVMHYDGDVDLHDLDKMKLEADGYVVESFYNPVDGRHWAKMIIVSEKGMEAVAKGWGVSNAYFTENSEGAGKWHSVDYTYKLKSGFYEHLAVVPNPRYEKSVIMDPEKFKRYCEEKENELKKFKNSEESEGGEKKMSKFKFFKREKVENSVDFETTEVELPVSKTTVTIEKLINDADKAIAEKKQNEGKPKYAEVEHLVKVGDDEITVNDLMARYSENCKKLNDIEEEKKKNAAEEEKDKEKNSDADKEKLKEKETNSQEHFNKLENAAFASRVKESITVETMSDQVSRGKARY